MVKSQLAKEKKYADHFKGEIPLVLPCQKDQEFIISYLSEVKKRSDYAYRNHKSALKDFFDNIDKNIEEISMIDVKNYFKTILDKKNIKKISKESRRSYLTSFFYHIQALLLDRDIEFRNPVPTRQVFQFTQFENDVKKYSDSKINILSINQIEHILTYCRRNLNKKYFIMFGLLMCTGARHSEIRSIKLKNLNLQERYFETGFEKNARKSTLKSQKALLFFFPNNFGVYLKNYIYGLDKKERWLFSAVNSKSRASYLNNSAIYRIKERIEKALGFKFRLHSFRNSLITNRIKMECPLWLSEGLMNHKSSSVEGEHYIKLLIAEKRDLYDNYFPYYSFPYF